MRLPNEQCKICRRIYLRYPAQRIAFIRKTHPPEQDGLLNGIGGKVELGESSVGAMVREAKEEADFDSTKDDWLLFHQERQWKSNRLLSFYVTDRPGMSQQVRTMTEENIEVWPYSIGLDGTFRCCPFIPGSCMYNLVYLLPMALAYLNYPDHRYLEG